MKKLIVHLVSESSIQTVKYAAETALARFSNIEVNKYHWPMVNKEELLAEVFSKIRQKPGVILYTISDSEIRDQLKKFASDMKLPCISVVSKIVKGISAYVEVEADDDGIHYDEFDQSYFEKVKAIDYTLHHDDGQLIDSLEEADIILIGPSRTSKTPTSVYLAYNGFKTANIPFIHGHDFPYLDKITKPLIVGLVINPGRLIEIRESRMNLLQVKEFTDYTDIKIVQEECRQVKNLCQKNSWDIIDVSRRSIEETAAIIMKSYYEHKKGKSKK